MTGKTQAEGAADVVTTWNNEGITPTDTKFHVTYTMPKGGIIFPLDSYTFYEFSLDGKTARFTPQEIFDAIAND